MCFKLFSFPFLIFKASSHLRLTLMVVSNTVPGREGSVRGSRGWELKGMGWEGMLWEVSAGGRSRTGVRNLPEDNGVVRMQRVWLLSIFTDTTILSAAQQGSPRVLVSCISVSVSLSRAVPPPLSLSRVGLRIRRKIRQRVEDQDSRSRNWLIFIHIRREW